MSYLPLYIIVTSLFLELLVHVVTNKKLTMILSGILGLLIGLYVSFVFIEGSLIVAFLLAYFSYFRFINILSAFSSTPRAKFFRYNHKNSSFIFCTIVLILGTLTLIQINSHSVLFLYSLLLLMVSAVALFLVVAGLRRMKQFSGQTMLPDSQLPTLTVAIPARNESEELTECIENILSSKYPKLEILVLDDCSQDRSADIIKHFAHRGVRFIKGTMPDDSWLPINHAYQQLAEHSSGDYILFSAVGIHYNEESFRRLVSIAKQNSVDMISALAHKHASYGYGDTFRPLRYFRMFLSSSRGQVTDAAWMIKRQTMIELGEFNGVKKAMYPERFFAKTLSKQSSYKLVSLPVKGEIISNRSASYERSQAIRKRYPFLQRDIFKASLLLLVQLNVLIVPFVLIVLLPVSFPSLLLFFTVITWMIIDGVILKARYINYWWLLPFGLPVAACVEIFISHESMRRYEFSSVDWKGRNICLPILETIPRLPKL